jgi:ankyrin repeat protein
VTNLDFVELLLKEGADTNAQDHIGMTALMCTILDAPSVAKFLLNWPTTDANIITQSGASFLAGVRRAITAYFFDVATRPDNRNKVQHQFLLLQWKEIEEMLVERGANDTGIGAFD